MEQKEFIAHAKRMKNRLMRLAYRILNNREDAEEAVQETFIKIWEKRSQIDQNANIDGFATVVLRNICLDKFKSKHYKHKKSDIEEYSYVLETSDVSPYKNAEYKDAAALVYKIIEDLPEKARQIIQLRDIDGFSNPEVAEILGIDENVVKVTLSRTRKKIREILINKYGYNYEH
ncbi:MAG TPA: RNA polymerase sigma factor [Candidatus Kapabacteria bacterium]|nr:RNA polymerase sigma factor [Candidatus Kapabacteria bacterium]HPP39510.1 RNA polymerase sigma factor [Candidatus Kapabacteria bacterium]